jgi:hypothetical protein
VRSFEGVERPDQRHGRGCGRVQLQEEEEEVAKMSFATAAALVLCKRLAALQVLAVSERHLAIACPHMNDMHFAFSTQTF